jgi:Tfp pilus assembly protein PilF
MNRHTPHGSFSSAWNHPAHSGAQAGWWHNLGIAYEGVDRPGDAAAAYRRAAEVDPTFAKDRRTAEWLETQADE